MVKSNDIKIIEEENVNGVMISLKIDDRKYSHKCKIFTITYKCNTKSQFIKLSPKKSFIMAIMFSILALWSGLPYAIEFSIFIIILFSVIFFWITHTVQSESLMVIPSVGVLTSVKFVYGSRENFVPWQTIQDIIINEVIKMNRVLYYLTLMVKDNHSEVHTMKLIPVFKFTKPRLAMLEEIYRELQTLMVEPLKGESIFEEPNGAGDNVKNAG